MDPLDENLASVCDICNRDFHFFGLLEKHKFDVHGDEDPLYCDLCTTKFRRKMNMIIHWRSTTHRPNKYSLTLCINSLS